MENLCDDLLVDIAKRLKKLEDFTCFRSVSKFLRTVVKDECFEGLRFRQGTPYLMLPVRDGNDNIRELYSLVEGESIVASLEVPKFKSKMCFESLGWLLTIEVDGSMSLVEPFSGTEIPVPHQNTFPGYDDRDEMDEHIFIQKMMLSSRPNETSDFVLMIIAGCLGHLGFWRLGDKALNKINGRKGRFCDVVYDVRGKQFYVMDNLGNIWVINLCGNDSHVEYRIIDCEPIPDSVCFTKNLYILKTVEDSLLAIRRSKDRLSLITNEFHVYEVDTKKKTWKEIYSLGRLAVFLGYNSSIALDASGFPGGIVKANHIYFTDDYWEITHCYFTHTQDEWKYINDTEEAIGGCVDSGVYNMETRAIDPIYPVEPLLNYVSPAMWITPCLCFQ